MHRLIPHADAVELAFVVIYIHIQAANALLCLMTYFYRLTWAFIAEPKSHVLTNLIFIYVTIYFQFSLIWNIQMINGMQFLH